MVLTQPGSSDCRSVPLIIEFPYHYGSYATREHRVEDSLMPMRFHTTMVLTQHSIDTAHIAASLFPYHYGSYATGGRQ